MIGYLCGAILLERYAYFHYVILRSRTLNANALQITTSQTLQITFDLNYLLMNRKLVFHRMKMVTKEKIIKIDFAVVFTHRQSE